jgi:FtsH-binding integral membrane protein
MLLLYHPAWMWFVAAAVLALCYVAVSHVAPRNLPVALIIAVVAPLSYTAYIFYLLATVDAERPAEAPTYFAIAGYYAAGALALALSAWLSRKQP